MNKRKRFGVSQALTRGLSETINVVENNAGIYRNVILPLTRLELDPENPRKLVVNLEDIQNGLSKKDPLYERKIGEYEKLKELAATIETSGVINPITVYKRAELYRIVAGERRYLASLLAGKNEIDARVFNEKPKGFDLKLIQWIENTAREDLSLEERIGNIREIIREYQNQNGQSTVTATFIKNITGLSLSQSSYYVAVLNAPKDVQALIGTGVVRNLDKAAIISSIEKEEVRREAIDACINGASIKDLRKIITQEKSNIQKEKSNIKPKRGRAVSRVNMGFTLNTGVVKTIVESVLNQTHFKKYSDVFSTINWNHLEQTTRAFKKLIEILELEIKRQSND